MLLSIDKNYEIIFIVSRYRRALRGMNSIEKIYKNVLLYFQ